MPEILEKNLLPVENDSKTIILSSPPKIEVIEVNRVSPLLYESFAEGFVSSQECNHITEVTEPGFDEEKDDTPYYCISLNQAEKSKEWIIWCSGDFEDSFDSFWIVFHESLQDRAEETLRNLGNHFKATFDDYDEDFHRGIQDILSELGAK